MKKNYVSKIAEIIISATRNCDIDERQTMLEKKLLEIGIESVWQTTPYNANTEHLQHEIAKELSEEVLILCKESPQTLAVAANCNLRLQEFNQKYTNIVTDFNILSHIFYF